MFARHIMCSTPIVQSGPAWQTSDLGIYNASTVYDLDRANRIFYRATGTRATFTGVAGRVGSDGRILLVTRAAASGSPSRVSLFATDKAGPVGDPVQDWAVPTGGILWNLYGRAAATYVQSGGGFLNPDPSYAIRHTDLAIGQSYAMGTVVAYGGTSLTGLTNGDDLYVLTGSYRGTFLGYKQGNSASWFTTVPASGGRAARAMIPRQVYDEKGIAAFWRMRAAAGPELVHLLPWRRPLTTATRVRAFGINLRFETVYNSNSGVNVDYVQAVTRRGKVYCGATLDAHEIEIGDSTGTAVLNGQPVSKHRLTVHLSSATGFILLSKSAATFIQTSRFDDDTGYDLLQYLDASGNPTGEFVRADTGAWNYVAPKVVQVGAYPIRVTVTNLLTASYDASGVASTIAFNVLDLSGAFVRTGTFPPGYSNASGYSMIHLVNADVLLTPIQWFKTGYASLDLGTTWIPVTGWGPRGSDPNKAPYNAARPAGQPPENTDVLANQPLFYT